MITDNICPKIGNCCFVILVFYFFHLGLSKGTKGVIVSWNDNYIFVKVSLCTVHFEFLPRNVIPISRTSKTFDYEGITFRRNQFPLVPAYVITDYKSQGETLEEAIIDLRIPPDGRWNIFHGGYVMNVKSIEFQWFTHSISIFSQ